MDLDDSVAIDLHFVELKTGQQPPTIDAILLQFRSPAPENEIEDPLIINIHKAGQVISSIEQKGSLRPKTQIKIEISAPIEESICVYWIDSGDNGLAPLYPKLDPRLNLSDEDACAFGGDDEFRTYRIPAHRTVGISGTGGIETCLVLRRQKSFDEEEGSKIEGVIAQVLELRNPSSFLHSPEYRYGTSDDFRDMGRRDTETRLVTGWQIEAWEAKLAEELEPYYEWLHLFHIPNLGSKVI